MKKFLSLVLALVMTMSLVTVSSGAKDFTDNSKINYKEAVDVMSAAKVIDGYAEGDFRPANTLTRGAAAKIICNLILGPTTAEALVADAAPYKDVPTTNTFAGYIAYCAKEGIISGYADGTFRPAASLSGYAFMKMLLGALGYDATAEGYTGANWSIQVAKRALNIELDDGLTGEFNGAKAVTREEACLYAFNTLKAPMVEYANSSSVTVNGITFTNKSDAKEITRDGETKDNYKKNVVVEDDLLNFGEKYFTKLDIGSETGDDFGRPAHEWVYDKDSVGTYADSPLATYAGADFDKDTLDDDFDGYDVADNIIYNGGKDSKVDMDYLESSVKGLNIELYGSKKNKTIDTIVVTEAYAAEVTNVETDDNDKIKSVDVTVYEAGRELNKEQGDYTFTIDVKKDKDAYAIVKGYEKDDVFAIFVKPGWDAEEVDPDDVIIGAEDVDTVEGEVTTISADETYNGWVKVGGNKYDFANEYSQAEVSKESEGTFYLYNGYVLHFDGSSENDDNYLYVVRTGSEDDKWGSSTYYAEVVFTDGTSKTVEVKKVDGKKPVETKTTGEGEQQTTTVTTYLKADTLYSYKHNTSKDTYELTTEIAKKDSKQVDISKGKTAIVTTSTTTRVATANSSTVFVNIKLDGTKFDKSTVVTGYKKASSMDDVKAFIVSDKGVADYVFTIDGTAKSDGKDMIYVAGKSVSKLIVDKDLDDYYTYNAVVDGKIVEIMVDASTTNANKLNGLFDSASVDSDNLYSDFKDAATADYETKEGVKFNKAEDDVVTLTKDKADDIALAYTDDVTVYVIDTDGDITTGSINRNYSNVDVTYTTNSDDEVTCFYIVKLG